MIDVMLGFMVPLQREIAALVCLTVFGGFFLPTWGQQNPDVRTTMIWCHKSEVAN